MASAASMPSSQLEVAPPLPPLRAATLLALGASGCAEPAAWPAGAAGLAEAAGAAGAAALLSSGWRWAGRAKGEEPTAARRRQGELRAGERTRALRTGEAPTARRGDAALQPASDNSEPTFSWCGVGAGLRVRVGFGSGFALLFGVGRGPRFVSGLESPSRPW